MPAPKKILVVAGSYLQAREWLAERRRINDASYLVIGNSPDAYYNLKGRRGCQVILVGKFRHRLDWQEMRRTIIEMEMVVLDENEESLII